MKKILLLIVLTLSVLGGAVSAQDVGQPAGSRKQLYGHDWDVKWSGAVCNDSTDDRTAINSAITAVTVLGGRLVIPGKCVVGSALTIPSNVRLVTENGGQLKPSTGIAIAINGPVESPPVQIFGGAGTINFSANAFVPVYYMQWWGAAGDNTADDTAEIQTAIDAIPATGAVLTSTAGAIHLISSTLTMLGKHSWQLGTYASLASYPKLRWNSTGSTLLSVLDCTQVLIKGWTFDLKTSSNTVNTFILIDRSVSTSSQIWIHNCWLNAANQNNASFVGIDIGPSGAANNENMQIENCIIVPSGSAASLLGDTGAMTASGTTLTFGSAVFAAGDVGKVVQIGLAGTAGATLTTTIAGFTSSTQVTTTDPAVGTVTNARVHMGRAYGTGIHNGPNSNSKHQIIRNVSCSLAYKCIDVSAGSVEIYNLGGSANNYVVYYANANTEPNIIEQMVMENCLVEIYVSTNGGLFDFRDLRGENSRQLTEGFWQIAGFTKISDSTVDGRTPIGGKLINFNFGSSTLTLTNFNALGSTQQRATWSDIVGTGELLAAQIQVLGYSNIAGWPAMGVWKGRSVDSTQVSFASADGMWMPGVGSLNNQTYVDPSYGLHNVTSRHTVIIGDDEIEIAGLFRPNVPGLRAIGTVGATTYYFAIVAVDSAGQRSLRSDIATITNANATLSGSNYVRVTWPPVQNAATYELYRVNPSDASQAVLVASGIATNSYNVVTNPGTGYAGWTTLTPAYNQASTVKFRARTSFPLEGTFTSTDTTPSVKTLSDWATANASSTSITTFDDGTEGQVIRVRVNDANTTFVNGATLNTGTGANITATNGYIYSFIYRGTVWRRLQ